MSLRSHAAHGARLVGRRGTALLFFAGVFSSYGVSLLHPTEEAPRTAVFRWFGEVMAMSYWGALWVACAVVCVGAAMLRGHHSDWIGYASAIGITAVWGLLCLWGWASADLQLSSVGIWLGFAGFVCLIAGWPEPEFHGDDQA